MRKEIMKEVRKQSDIVGPHNEGQEMIDLNRLDNILRGLNYPLNEIKETLIYNQKDVITDSHALERIERLFDWKE